MSTIKPITVGDSGLSIDFAPLCAAKVERVQAKAHKETEHLYRISNFAKDLFSAMLNRLIVKPQILAEQEARLARDYARQR